jgi:AraC-like DNA-binding protein
VSAIGRWANGETHDIEDLAATLGVSARTAERLCAAACGLPPRQLANRHRILRMAAVLALGIDNRRDTWTEDYADQSHFIRNFKRYVGVSPTRFLREPDLLVREVMRVRLAIASAHPLGLAPNSERPDQPSTR